MNDVRLHVPYIFGNKQNSKSEREEEETDAEEGTTKRQRSLVPREAHGRP